MVGTREVTTPCRTPGVCRDNDSCATISNSQLATRGVAQPGIAPKIMWCEVRHANLPGVLFNDMTDHFLCQAIAPSSASAANRPG
jgi:hypothetical protein